MTESTLVEVKSLQAILDLLERLSVSLQDKQLWDLLTQCEQAKAGIQKWIYKDEDM